MVRLMGYPAHSKVRRCPVTSPDSKRNAHAKWPCRVTAAVRPSSVDPAILEDGDVAILRIEDGRSSATPTHGAVDAKLNTRRDGNTADDHRFTEPTTHVAVTDAVRTIRALPAVCMVLAICAIDPFLSRHLSIRHAQYLPLEVTDI